MRGYFSIGIENPIKEENIGTLWRSAYSFGAAYTFQIGGKFVKQSSDTCATYKHVPHFVYESVADFYKNKPSDCIITGIEMVERSKDLKSFCHPERTIYILGSERTGLSDDLVSLCDCVVKINTKLCLNVSVAGSIVMFDRINKM